LKATQDLVVSKNTVRRKSCSLIRIAKVLRGDAKLRGAGKIGERRKLNEEILAYYEKGREEERLPGAAAGRLEYMRTRELLSRHLPPAPATVLDIGGGAGVYALPLAREGYSVYLIDPVPLHVEQAAAASESQSGTPLAGAEVGDARSLSQTSETVDAVLLLGPLYHLTSREDRLRAFREARRVVRPGGAVLAAAISRFASTIDGLFNGFLAGEEFEAIVERDLSEGQHRNPGERPGWFTTAYFHRPAELREEAEEAGIVVDGLFGIEGPAWPMPDLEAWLGDPARRKKLFVALRRVESEPELLGASAHLLLVGRRT
jgi:SAM-dependent methyltransferase